MEDTTKHASESYSGMIKDLPTFNASDLAPEITKRIIFGPERHWMDFTMRHFILSPGFTVPPHTHEWAHFALGLEGKGQIVVDGEVCPLPAGSWGYIPGGVVHSFENVDSQEDFAFICIVPTHGDPHGKMQRHRIQRAEKKRQKQEDQACYNE